MATSTPLGEHRWTAFEQHALLCLIARQIQTTSTRNFKDNRKRGRKRQSFDFTGAVQLDTMDVTSALNRALNFRDQTKDIPHEEVSAMTTKLLCERKAAVKYIERQRVAKVTRAMKRVWNRALRFNGSLEEQLEQLAMEKAGDERSEKNTRGAADDQVSSPLAGAWVASAGMEWGGGGSSSVAPAIDSAEIEWGGGSSTVAPAIDSADPWADALTASAIVSSPEHSAVADITGI